jgi:hypothetical protein
MSDDALRDNRGHESICIMDPLAALKFEREGDRIGEVIWIGWRQLFVIGHPRTIDSLVEQSKNAGRAGGQSVNTKSPARGGRSAQGKARTFGVGDKVRAAGTRPPSDCSYSPSCNASRSASLRPTNAWRKAGATMSSDRKQALLREIADKRAELDSMSDLVRGKIIDDYSEVRRTLRGKIKELRLELEVLNRDASRS